MMHKSYRKFCAAQELAAGSAIWTMPPIDPIRAISHALKWHRLSRGLSIAQLSAAADVAPDLVTAMEAGQADVSLSILNRMAVALDVPLAVLLGEDGPPHDAEHASKQ